MVAPGDQPADPGHRQVVDALKVAAGHGPLTPAAPDPRDSHSTSGRPFYGLSAPDQRRLVRRWLSNHRSSTPDQVFHTVESLLAGPSYEEKSAGCMILKERADVRRQASPAHVVAWLHDLRGWAEVDSLCQSVFAADDLLPDWASWRAVILELSQSANANKRRAALVLLTAPVRQSSDERLLQVAIRVIDQLRADRDALITKAVSWLLRALTVNHADAVVDYLARRGSELAPVALRETRTKLRTGTKSGKSASTRKAARYATAPVAPRPGSAEGHRAR